MRRFKSSFISKLQILLCMVLMTGTFSPIFAAVNPEFELLQSFDKQVGHPVGKLIQDTDGNAYGVTGYVDGQNLGAIFQIDAAGNYTVLHAFDGANGWDPRDGVIQGSDGKLYGTTYSGGSADAGTVFQLDISGDTPVYTVLHSFDGSNGGGHPKAGVSQGNDGKLYGTTYLGGGYGIGTVYQLDISTANPVFELLHDFPGSGVGYPDTRVTQGVDGKIYGTSKIAGGSIFQIDMSADIPGFSIVHRFDSVSDSGFSGDLIQASDGKYYGATSSGGSANKGTVFQLDPSGVTPLYTVLHEFDETTGANPLSGLVKGTDGKIYGITTIGGQYGNGTIYQVDISPDAAVVYTLLHEFDGINGTGATAKLIQGSNGKIYGTTSSGGTVNKGTVFQLDHSEATPVYTVLYDFDEATGAVPDSLIQASDGSLYGITSEGGLYGGGVAYRISMNSPVNTPSIAANDSFVLNPIITGTVVFAPGVVGNDTDAEGDALTVVGATDTTPRIIMLASGGGKVALYADGHFVYTPLRSCFFGTRSFTYQVTDGHEVSNPATVTLTIRPRRYFSY